MGTVITRKDGRTITICSDTDFQDLIREALGDNAAEFYKDRLEDKEDFPSFGKRFRRKHE